MSFPHLHRSRELPPTWLVIACLALPQIAETVLAPGLPSVARAWQLSAADTQWVMSLFFLGFSAGVLLWGQVADRWGRRPALLLGLALALAGTAWGIVAPSYAALLAGRFVQALGMATCSVTTQTLLRDRLSGAPLPQTVRLAAFASFSVHEPGEPLVVHQERYGALSVRDGLNLPAALIGSGNVGC